MRDVCTFYSAKSDSFAFSIDRSFSSTYAEKKREERVGFQPQYISQSQSHAFVFSSKSRFRSMIRVTNYLISLSMTFSISSPQCRCDRFSGSIGQRFSAGPQKSHGLKPQMLPRAWVRPNQYVIAYSTATGGAEAGSRCRFGGSCRSSRGRGRMFRTG